MKGLQEMKKKIKNEYQVQGKHEVQPYTWFQDKQCGEILCRGVVPAPEEFFPEFTL